MKIRVTHTFLAIDEKTGVSWQLDGDIQDFFFRLGNSEDGEDPTHWMIIEWRDLPPDPLSSKRLFTAPTGSTWGSIKLQYTQ